MTHIWKLFEAENIPFSCVFVTDWELALTNAIDDVFSDQAPGRIYQFICSWHVHQNILGHAKKHFWIGVNNDDKELNAQYDKFMKDWKLVLWSATVSEFDANWVSFQQNHPPLLVKYVRQTWIEPHKTCIIWAWVNQASHFDHWASSQVEGSHHMIKQYILTSTGDLYIIFQCILCFWKAQHDTWQADFAGDKTQTSVFATRNPYFVNLCGQVSTHSLHWLYAEWRIMAKKWSQQQCSIECSFHIIWGLSCRHLLRFYVESGTSIPLSSIHSHWLYNQSQQPKASGVSYSWEPEVIQWQWTANKVSHKKNYGKGSMWQDLTWTERVERHQHQQGQQQILGVAKAPRDDQHTVYTTGAGSVIGSGSAAPPKWLSIRSPDCSPRKSKWPRDRCSAAASSWIEVERELVDLTSKEPNKDLN